MAIYLIRHGESEGNIGDFFQGSLDCALTTRGEEQAHTVGRWLKSRQITPSVVYASPLQRAWRTAAIIAREIGAPDPVPCPAIAEYHAGELQGLTLPEIDERFPEYHTRPYMLRGDFSPWGGESYEEMQRRLSSFVAQLQSHPVAADVVAVAHGGSLYQLLKLCCGRPVPRHYFTRIRNCTCFKLAWRELPGESVAELNWMVPLELMS